MAGLLDKYLDPNVDYRGALLPLARMKDGSMALAWPQAAVELGRAFTYPGDVMTGGRPLTERGVTDMAAGVVGGAGTSGLLFGPRGGATLGMNVWHGGPHKWAPEPGFPQGRPRLDKVGTGEGGQAYGHGWYSAEARDVGAGYKDALSGNQRVDFIQRKMMDGGASYSDARAASSFIKAAVDPDVAARDYANWIGRPLDDETVQLFRDAIKQSDGGTLYKLDLPDEDVAKYLDWDAPLSEQPDVYGRLRAHWDETLGDPDIIEQRLGITPNSTGGDLYHKLGGLQENKKATSEALRKAGIPGLKYYDGMSRGRGEGTRNYVTWDQDVLDRMKLLERNGEIFNMNPATAGPLGILNAIEQDRRNREWIKGGGA